MRRFLPIPLVLLALTTAGCYSPYHTDRGALMGGLGGAGVGALIGSTVGSAGPGAAIGAGVGTLAGAAMGAEMDQVEARNRAMIEAKMGSQAASGAASVQDVLAMRQAGVADELIINHVRGHGMGAPLSAQDLILLQQQRVPPNVIQAMQDSPPRMAAGPQPVLVPQPGPVVIQEYPYYWGPPHYYRPHPCYPHGGHGLHWGVSVGH